jgi:hypothetical protein
LDRTSRRFTCCCDFNLDSTVQVTLFNYLKHVHVLTYQCLFKAHVTNFDTKLVSYFIYVKHVCYYLIWHVFYTKCEHSSQIHDAPAFKSMRERNLRNRAPGAGNQAPLTEQKIIKPESQTWF